jgi:hypothetical protein
MRIDEPPHLAAACCEAPPIERDVRLAASKLQQHLRDLGVERSLVRAIVGLAAGTKGRT